MKVLTPLERKETGKLIKGINQDFSVESHYLTDDGVFPNNRLPVLHYRRVLSLPVLFPSAFVKKLFGKNQWTNAWKNGIYHYHHYHSLTHEVLGVYAGKATLLLGGEKGVHLTIEKGDVLLIPAGVAHKNMDPDSTVKCVGAYPDGRDYDMNYGQAGERPRTDETIRQVPLPSMDPVFGKPIHKFWL